jgi:GNAT superfamily N-acetyltransferase
MQNWMEERMRAVAASHPPEIPKLFHVTAFNYQEGKARLLESLDYLPVRYFYNMVRPTLEDIPDYPLPEGIELRPALPEHYRLIWDDAHSDPDDEWGYVEPTEERYQEWLAELHFQPHLWQVAWEIASNQTVGHVLTFIDEKENEQFNRKRGYTEGVGVRGDWRRKGLAKAMIARSLLAQKAAGMTESALAADADSQSNATRLYECLGFQIANRDTIYRKHFKRI